MVDIDTTGAEVLRQAITMLAERDITFAVSRADRSFRSWLEKYELMELIDESHFYPTNRHAAAAFREDRSDEEQADEAQRGSSTRTARSRRSGWRFSPRQHRRRAQAHSYGEEPDYRRVLGGDEVIACSRGWNARRLPPAIAGPSGQSASYATTTGFVYNPTMPMAEQHLLPLTLETGLEFERLLSELSSRFINLPPGEVDREINDALRRVCELLGIDLAVLWQWSGATPSVIMPTHTFPPQEELEAPEPLHRDQYPWYVQQMLAGRVIVMPSMDELPAEAAVDRESCRVLGIKSNLCLPLSGGGQARRRPGSQHPAGGARLAGCAGATAATGCAGLHQRARPQAPRADRRRVRNA